MSGTQVSPWGDPTILLNTLSGAQTQNVLAQQIANQYAPQRNELLIAKGRQEVGANEIEYLARASQGLLDLNDETAMRAAYPGVVSTLQGYGFAKNAPSEFPGVDRLKQIAAMGVPSEKLYTQRANIAANIASIGGDGTAAAPGAGGGGGGTTDYNYGNIRPVGATTGFNTYATPQEGVAAMSSNLAAYANQHGIKTLNGLTARWAPKGDGNNDPAAYAQTLGKMLGIDPNAEINLADPVLQMRLIPAMAQVEKGRPFNQSQDVLTAGIQAGLSGKPAVASQPPAGGGVAARYPGAVTVAGPGAAASAATTAPAAATSATTDLVGPRPVPQGPNAPEVTPQSLANTPVPVAQNQLAPTPAPAPAPAPAATPPAAPAVPAVPLPPQPAPRLANGLMAPQDREMRGLAGRLSPEQFETRKVAYIQQNDAREAAYRTALKEQEQTTYTRQKDVAEATDKAERLRIAQAEAARKQKEDEEKARLAKLPFQGTADPAQLRNILITGDPKSPEYHSAYAAYAEPRTGEGGLVITPNMQPYRMPQDADGNPITTYDQPKFSLGPGNIGELRKIETQASALTAALDDFLTTANNASFTERAATAGGAQTDLRSAWTNAALMSKGEALYALGVLSGPDMTVLRGALSDPSTIMGWIASGPETRTKQVNRIKRLLETRIDQARRSYGGGMSPSGPTTSSAPTAPADRPPLSSFVTPGG